MDVRQKQICVIEFLKAEKLQPIDIYKRLVNVYGGKTIDISTVRKWVCRFQSGDRDMMEKPCSDRPSTATNQENEARLNKFIQSNWRITVNQMSTELGVSVGAVIKLIPSLVYSRRCARWIPRVLTPEQKDYRVPVSLELLKRYEAKGDAFLN